MTGMACADSSRLLSNPSCEERCRTLVAETIADVPGTPPSLACERIKKRNDAWVG